jgi:predicted enzyme related to lactoylglutathione lyase
MAEPATAVRETANTANPQPSWTHGSFWWNELMAHDSERARNFYAQTIGWEFEPMPMPEGGTYWIAKLGDKMIGGIFELREECHDQMPEIWMPYLAVDDVEARVEKARAAGATLMRPLFDVPNIGRIAMLREPGGAMVGWITPAMR